jgi:hypothetical protein
MTTAPSRTDHEEADLPPLVELSAEAPTEEHRQLVALAEQLAISPMGARLWEQRASRSMEKWAGSIYDAAAALNAEGAKRSAITSASNVAGEAPCRQT